MMNKAIVNRKDLTAAFEPPKLKGLGRVAKKGIPQTTILKGASNVLVIEGAFLETTLVVEGKWKREIELITTEVYDLLKNKLPKSELITISIDENDKFVMQIDKLVVSINIVKT